MPDPRFVKYLLAAKARAGAAPSKIAPPPCRPAPSSTGDKPTLVDDAFHYKYYSDSPGAFWYCEWWYFNFCDPAQKLSGMCAINVFNPGDIDLLGLPVLTAAVFDGSSPVVEAVTEIHPIGEFSASYERPQAALAASHLEAIDDNTMHVAASTADGQVKMDLTYQRNDDAIFLAKDVFGHDQPWEESSWLVAMPSALVTGTVQNGANKYQLNAVKGYHDHDWGMWHVYAKTWSWAQFCNPARQIAFDLGFHAAFQVSDAYVRFGDVRVIIPQEKFNITQDEWVTWKIFYKYPTKMTFTGEDASGQYRIELAWQIDQTSPIWKSPVIVFEQAATFTGKFMAKTDTGWRTLTDINENGFAEFTDLWY